MIKLAALIVICSIVLGNSNNHKSNISFLSDNYLTLDQQLSAIKNHDQLFQNIVSTDQRFFDSNSINSLHSDDLNYIYASLPILPLSFFPLAFNFFQKGVKPSIAASLFALLLGSIIYENVDKLLSSQPSNPNYSNLQRSDDKKTYHNQYTKSTNNNSNKDPNYQNSLIVDLDQESIDHLSEITSIQSNQDKLTDSLIEKLFINNDQFKDELKDTLSKLEKRYYSLDSFELSKRLSKFTDYKIKNLNRDNLLNKVMHLHYSNSVIRVHIFFSVILNLDKSNGENLSAIYNLNHRSISYHKMQIIKMIKSQLHWATNPYKTCSSVLKPYIDDVISGYQSSVNKSLLRSEANLYRISRLVELEQIYLSLHPDRLSFMLKTYFFQSNHILKLNHCDLLTDVISLDPNLKLEYAHVFFSTILKLDSTTRLEMAEIFNINGKKLTLAKKQLIQLIKDPGIWIFADNLQDISQNHNKSSFRSSNLTSSNYYSKTAIELIDLLKQDFLSWSKSEQKTVMSEWLSAEILQDYSSQQIFDYVQNHFNLFHLFVFLDNLNTSASYSYSEIVSIFDLSTSSLITQAIHRLKKHLSNIHRYDLTFFTHAAQIEEFLGKEITKILNNSHTSNLALIELADKYFIDHQHIDHFIKVTNDLLLNLSDNKFYQTVMINHLLPKSLLSSSQIASFYGRESSGVKFAIKKILDIYKLMLIPVVKKFDDFDTLYNYQRAVINKVSNYELNLYSRHYATVSTSRSVLSDRIENIFIRLNINESDKKSSIFFARVLKIPNISIQDLSSLTSFSEQDIIFLDKKYNKQWAKKYTINSLEPSSFDSLQTKFYSLSSTQWRTLFKINANKSNIKFKTFIDLVYLYYQNDLDDIFKKHLFLSFVLKLDQPSYLSFEKFRLVRESKFDDYNSQVVSLKSLYQYIGKKFHQILFNINTIEEFDSIDEIEYQLNDRYSSLSNKKWIILAKNWGYLEKGQVNIFKKKLEDYLDGLHGFQRTIFLCRVLGLCSASLNNIDNLYEKDRTNIAYSTLGKQFLLFKNYLASAGVQ